MGTKKKFTPEELKHLQANPYTLRVTADSISYTLAFKEAYRFRGYAKGVRGIHMLTWPSSFIAGRPFLMSKSKKKGQITMKKTWHSLKNRVTAMLLALICVLGLLPTAALAAGADTIKLERFGMSGVSYQSASLGRCTMHQMYYGVAGKTSVGFCGTKGGGMGTSLIGQTWGHPKPIADPTVKMMMAYYYAHSLGIFTDKARALGVDDIWDSGYSWYMNAWVQAIVWRYEDGSLGDPATACAEELMYVWNSLKGASYTSIDQTCDGTTFRDWAKYILDLGKQGVWGDCGVKEYSFTGAGSAAHPASTVQSVMIGNLISARRTTPLTSHKPSSQPFRVRWTTTTIGSAVGAETHVFVLAGAGKFSTTID